MEIFKYHVEKTDILPLKKMYLLRAGFKNKYNELDDKMGDIVNKIYKQGMEVVKPELYYFTLPFNDIGCFKLQIPKKFGYISKITYFISTLGETIDDEINNYLSKNNILQASLLDAWASESLEFLNEVFDKKIRKNMKEGTMRFSPGYDDLDITENIKIVDIFKQYSNLNVQVMESGIMIPRKTTTCLIGWSE